ncbi:hypothetical protein HMPREF1544_11085 [Mucor circinelloides 1006PhL]|uniref:Uncharacterized protein n=1 Tax=Mucor circinelloides f. circinelloides (strain 1006PhL) TaxID=1220926 RepID=S2J1W9_MUCC1|nr:hypothetical protein HMPREF1544_11085 [Mucor circinelloides 1006PhL]
MLPNFDTVMFPEVQNGSLMISSVTTALMLALCLRSSRIPKIVGCLGLTAGFISIIASALLVSRSDRIGVEPYYYLFYILYYIVICLPVLVLLRFIARQQNQRGESGKSLRIGTGFIYVRYF